MIWRIVIDNPLHQYFDYLPPTEISTAQVAAGIRVRVPFGRQKLIGVLVEIVSASDIPFSKLKHVIEVIDAAPLITDKILSLAKWAANYYHAPFGQTLFKTLPPLLRRGKLLKPLPIIPTKLKHSDHVVLSLTTEQTIAIQHIRNAQHFEVFLLAGITGSGKTEVYLQAAQNQLQQNKQILILVPEISLTPQTVSKIKNRLHGKILTYSSALTDNEKLKTWQKCFTDHADIVIGTRSALFLPLTRLGLIIIDEEHDLSYKSQQNIRFGGRDLAILRAKQENVPIVLGSATPSLETIYNVKCGRYQKLSLTQRPNQSTLPEIKFIDIRNLELNQGLTTPLIEIMRQHLDAKQQVLLFLNRRGFSPLMTCHNCGYIATCKHCDVRLVYHKKSQQLHCHHCGQVKTVPALCPACHRSQLLPIGLGTERLENALQNHFPDIPVTRIDRDTIKHKGELAKKLEQIHEGGAQILIGTQMLAKGHDFPNLTLVAIVDADAGLFGLDFRTTERLGQLFMQVAGRAGRSHLKGEVVLQTRHPDSPILQLLKAHDYDSFSQYLLKEREEMSLPPYSHLALIRATSRHQEKATNFLQEIKILLQQNNHAQIEILGPNALPQAKKAGFFRSQLLLQAKNRPPLQDALKHLTTTLHKNPLTKGVQWLVDIDPLEIF